jgi:hypothetical protein
MFVAAYLTGSNKTDISFVEFVQLSNIRNMIIFFVVFGLVYPFFGYLNQKIYLNRPFEEDKQEIIRLFSETNFVLYKDEDKKLIFRHKNPVTRFMRLYEDEIMIDYSENPILMNGLRRDTFRLTRMVQHITLRGSEEEQD